TWRASCRTDPSASMAIADGESVAEVACPGSFDEGSTPMGRKTTSRWLDVIPVRATGVDARGPGLRGPTAAGALAVGATALGAVAIGRLAIGHASIKRLVIDDL